MQSTHNFGHDKTSASGRGSASRGGRGGGSRGYNSGSAADSAIRRTTFLRGARGAADSQECTIDTANREATRTGRGGRGGQQNPSRHVSIISSPAPNESHARTGSRSKYGNQINGTNSRTGSARGYDDSSRHAPQGGHGGRFNNGRLNAGRRIELVYSQTDTNSRTVTADSHSRQAPARSRDGRGGNLYGGKQNVMADGSTTGGTGKVMTAANSAEFTLSRFQDRTKYSESISRMQCGSYSWCSSVC